MANTYDLATDVGKVRLLIGDTGIEDPLFSDEELTAFVELEEGSVYRGAASALDAIAVSEALTLKAVTVLDLTTNGPAVAESLRYNASRLREMAADEVLVDFAEMMLTPQNTLEMWIRRNWPL